MRSSGGFRARMSEASILTIFAVACVVLAALGGGYALVQRVLSAVSDEAMLVGLAFSGALVTFVIVGKMFIAYGRHQSEVTIRALMQDDKDEAQTMAHWATLMKALAQGNGGQPRLTVNMPEQLAAGQPQYLPGPQMGAYRDSVDAVDLE